MEKNHRISVILNIILAISLLVAVAVTAYSINQVRSLESEAKGKPATPPGQSKETSASLAGSPNPADAGSVVHIVGCGYDAGTEVHIEHATKTDAYSVWVWGNGCIDFPYQTAEAGTYSLKAFQQGKRGLTLLAEGTLEVQ